MNHLEILQSTPAAQVGDGRQNLLNKTTGKFYTPYFIGTRLVDSVLTLIIRKDWEGELSVIDPFCGDGRLITWLIEHAQAFPHLMHRLWRIEVWDCDTHAVELAKQNIQRTANEIGLRYSLKAVVQDSFLYCFSLFIEKQTDETCFDITITNPPWEVVKPDRRDTEVLDRETEVAYINSLRDYSKTLAKCFPLSMPRKMFSGWGVNLARVGLEVAVRLTKNQGVTGIISPATILGDQNSEMLRKWLLTNHSIKYIDYFPAETKLFNGVDQACVNITIQTNTTSQKIFLYKFDEARRYTQYHQELKLPETFLTSNGYIIPIYNNESQFAQLSRLCDLPTLLSLQGNGEGELWTGRELDETGHTSYLSLQGNYPFIKGKMIQRLTKVSQPTFFIKKEKELDVPASVNYPRIVWRDVSRQTQKRRVQATIIPAQWVTGNSLGVAHFRTNDLSKLYTLLGIMSSLPFEFQVRSMLSTAHVSVGVLRKTRIPLITPQFSATVVPLVEQILAGNLAAEAKMEVIVAKAYGLNRLDLASMMNSFPKLTTQERQTILDHPLWEEF
ncbi:Alw26I/Eco31I/Esp3I family type II restriction adenine-specific DNA-methyltransferase [Iningainema tapete]|uniref:site-specific DNA-methyltransferase (adenine-specific) n=1 Tax=Iningainema tapete BLCC-T55 TaxID=2748662 RepID=A0A8J7BZU1_9CYAN|nr:Alw26I/Eco31I/Esp3I family type II restriction adenine-specific DNA-methyltransferase [Iningainema tapete BLCC-T55]